MLPPGGRNWQLIYPNFLLKTKQSVAEQIWNIEVKYIMKAFSFARKTFNF
jgi:hypothetical protein